MDLSDLLVPYITLFIVENNLQNSLMSMLFNDLGEAGLYGAGLDKAESGETDLVEDSPENIDLEGLGLQQIGKTDDYLYFCLRLKNDEHLQDAEYDTEFMAIQDRIDEVLSLFDFYAPRDPYQEKTGTVLSFETTDLDGNPVSSEEIFSRHEYTLLNIWASWCEPCKGELAELDALNDRLADMDCGVVGLLQDSAKESRVEKAKAIMAEKGATYLCIKAPDGLEEMLLIENFPTTYVIDRSGTVVETPIVGAYVNAYEERVNDLLKGKTLDIQDKKEEKPTYTVTVLDQNGDPVAEAAVGFCLDTGCVPVETDENGVAVFSGAPNRYHIRVVDAPDEYDYPDDTDLYIGPESGEMTLTITKE